MMRAGEIADRIGSRWPLVLEQLGIAPEFLVNRHGPCPACGGRDRFRFDNRFNRGGFYCNQCGAGDGFKLLQLVHGWDFKAARDRVLEAAGLGSSAVRPDVYKPVPPKSAGPASARPPARVRRLRSELCRLEDCADAIAYLESRALWPAAASSTLRAHASVEYYEDGQRIDRYPALIAAVRDFAGELVTTHVTYLASGRKLAEHEPRKILSTMVGRGIEQEVARLEVQLRQATGTEAIANARESISEIGAAERQGALERLAAERDVWSQVLAGENLTAAQRIEVQRSLNSAITGLAREAATESATIARQDASADMAIARLKIEAAKSAIDLTAAADQAAVAAKLAALKTLTTQEEAQNEAALTNELDALKTQPAAYDAVNQQILELKAKLVADLAALDRQAATASQKDSKEQVTEWQKAVGEITSAESGLVSDLLNKRKSLSQSLLSIGANLVTQEIANDLRAVTTSVLLHTEGEAQKKALEQGGFLYHEVIELMKTKDTTTQQAAQNAAVASGAATQNSELAAAATASRGIEGTIGVNQVMADAARAFAGAYASTTEIPIVGPELAPAAGAAAFSAVASQAGLAALALGTNYVPRDMIAHIHQGEAVVPRAYNPAAQGGGSGGGDTVHHHYGDIGHITVSDSDIRGMLESTRGRDALVSALATAFRRGARL